MLKVIIYPFIFAALFSVFPGMLKLPISLGGSPGMKSTRQAYPLPHGESGIGIVIRNWHWEVYPSWGTVRGTLPHVMSYAPAASLKEAPCR